MNKKLIALGTVAASVGSAFASTSSAPSWVPATTVFDSVIGGVAPVAIAVVVAVAGVRVCIKLLNRAAGK